MQFVELHNWNYRFDLTHLGVDDVDALRGPDAFITIIVVAAGWEVINMEARGCPIQRGLPDHVQLLMNGIFTWLDGVLFYVFFEASLIPMYLIIGVWGSTKPFMPR